MSDQRPNFLIFLTDQQRGDHLGCMGNPVLQTPNIDRIGREGIIYDHAYINNPVCMPSRATLFTGRTPRGHRVRGNGNLLDPDIPTMPGALAQAGYWTHNVGKVHLTPTSPPKGMTSDQLDTTRFKENRDLWNQGKITSVGPDFYGLKTCDLTVGHCTYISGQYYQWLQREHPHAVKYIDDPQSHCLQPPTGADQSFKWAMPADLHYNTWIADRTIDFLQQRQKANDSFFTFCSFPDPHHPFCPPAPWCDMYDPADIPLPTRRDGELDDMPPFYRTVYETGMQLSGRVAPTKMPDDHIREIIAHTYGMVSFVDQQVGRVLDELDRLGLAENTVVMFLTDHGDMMGDHWLLNKGPFMYQGLIRSPMLARWPGHITPGQRTSAIMSHLDFVPTILDMAGVPIPQGEVAPEVEYEKQMPPLPGVSQLPVMIGQKPAVRDRALVEFDEDYLGYRLRTLVTHDYRITIYPGEPFGELFDLRQDPDEWYNRWDDPDYAQLKAQALSELLAEEVLTESALPRRLSHA